MPHSFDTAARAPFNAGLACWERRDAVAAASDLLRRLARLVGGANDLALYQWGQLFSAALDFAPSLILELGRHRGNSTCVFTSAAAATDARVVSVCLSDAWRREVRGRIAGVVPLSWFERLDAREADICTLDFDEILGEATRVLVFWDAHGYHIAEHVLGRLLPAMEGRERLVLMHDMSDVRYEGGGDPGYRGHGLWRANDWSGPRIRLGSIESCVEQAVAVFDFASRNQLTLRSAAEDLHEVIGRHPFRVEAMQALLGDLFALEAHWFHFCPDQRSGRFAYPSVARVLPPTIADEPSANRGHAPEPQPADAPMRRGPVLVAPTRHRQSLEIVVTGRADDHGGPEFLERLCAAARHNHALLSAARIAHTFTLVEWNPVPGRPLLAEQVAAALPFWHRCWVVAPEWHAAISVNPRLGFMEFFAKNVGIRRATADLVLTTNSDVFLSQALVERLGDVPLADEHVYRAVRHDVDRRVDWRTADDAVLGDPRHHLRVNALHGPEFANAAGDFLLLTRATYLRLRGFNETVRFAKIHKDGQFCHRAWIEGLPIVSLGPIWHLDHDGSYSNVGTLRGSADAPYGPEWDWRADYRNPAEWGLAPAVAVPGDGPIVWLHHPRTHGPLLDMVPRSTADTSSPREEPDGPTALADAIAQSTGQYVLVNAPGDLSEAEREALASMVAREQPDRAVFAGAYVQDPGLGPVPSPGAPLIVSRAALERAGGWPEAEAPADVAFWIAAGGPEAQIATWPSARTLAAAAVPLRPLQRVLAHKARGAEIPSVEWRAAALDAGRAIAEVPRLLDSWVASLALPIGARIAVCGPDWATPGLLTAVRAAGCPLAGLYTADARVEGTIRWGCRVRRLERVVADGAVIVLAAALGGAAATRLARAGFAGTIHRLHDPAPAGFVADLPSELSLLTAALQDAMAAGDVAEATDRLTELAALAGATRAVHAYDAALGWERRGRPDEALRLFESVVAAETVDAELRSRARFHAGRLAFERGDHEAAREHLSTVLIEVPDHRRARALMDAMSPKPEA